MVSDRVYHGPVIHQLVDELQRGSSPEQLGLKTEEQQQVFRDYETKCCHLKNWQVKSKKKKKKNKTK